MIFIGIILIIIGIDLFWSTFFDTDDLVATISNSMDVDKSDLKRYALILGIVLILGGIGCLI